MAGQTLTIRNLTATSIELRLLERYVAPASESRSGIAALTRNITHLVLNPATPGSLASPSASRLAANTQTFSHEEVSISIGAFGTCRTGIRPCDPSSNGILRLTFENHGERYRLDTPGRATRSTTLTPLTPNPRFQYTAVYLPLHSHLTLLSSADLQSWMKALKDGTPLSGLSIPGTHNSPTHHRALPSVRCQAVSPRIQLENGVRFFDVRVQPESPSDPTKDGLLLVHGVFPIALLGTKYFRDLVNEVHDFLDQNPSETLIMSIKREGVGDATDAQLSRILKDHYVGDSHRWYTAPHIPSLGDARRKIVLVRRFGLDESLKGAYDGAGWGIDAETWVDNTPNDTCPSGAICVQDFYEVLETESIEKKIGYSEAHLDRAGACVCALPNLAGGKTGAGDPSTKQQPMYLNFLSASNFWKVGCWPERIAAKLNPAIVEYLCTKYIEPDSGKTVGDGTTGIVVCDWVGNNGDWDLVRCIVGMNAKLELREQGTMGSHRQNRSILAAKPGALGRDSDVAGRPSIGHGSFAGGQTGRLSLASADGQSTMVASEESSISNTDQPYFRRVSWTRRVSQDFSNSPGLAGRLKSVCSLPGAVSKDAGNIFISTSVSSAKAFANYWKPARITNEHRRVASINNNSPRSSVSWRTSSTDARTPSIGSTWSSTSSRQSSVSTNSSFDKYNVQLNRHSLKTDREAKEKDSGVVTIYGMNDFGPPVVAKYGRDA